MAASQEEESRAAIDEDADGGDGDDGEAGRGLRLAESPHRLGGDAAGDDEEGHRVRESSKDRTAPPTIGIAPTWPAPAEQHGEPGDGEPQHVAEIVPGIGEKG